MGAGVDVDLDVEARLDGVGDVSEIRGLLRLCWHAQGLALGAFRPKLYIFLVRVVKQQANAVVILYSLHTGVLP